MLKNLLKPKIILLFIVLLGAFFRFYNVDWDQGQHLHPDERFLTMVATAMMLPTNPVTYLDPQLSTMNPANIGHPFYVYGTLPVVLTKFLAVSIGGDNYTDITIIGRMLSALADVLVIIFIYKTFELLERRHKYAPHIKYWAALFYAIAVLPIQLAHFFAVDTFLNLFCFASFYFALRFTYTKSFGSLILSAICFGLAIGSKISAIYVFPIIGIFLLLGYIPHWKMKKEQIVNLLIGILSYALTVYIVGRIADPYLFQTANLLDPTPNKLFLENIKTLQYWGSEQSWFPPAVQWINKTPFLFPLSNLIFFGWGVGLSVLTAMGVIFIFNKYRHKEWWFIFTWVVVFLVYQGIQFASSMRYFILVYPFLALIAAIGFYELAKHRSAVIKAVILLPAILWTLFFFSIYTKDHSRNEASRWMYQNIPTGYTLLSEHWDDALPLSTNPPSPKVYTIEQLPVFDPDTPEKWQKMDEMLTRGDYLILSSNRGWGSIPTVPERYPRMSKYYDDLFAGRTQYKKVAEFTSYPSLNYLGIPLSIPDDWAEEAFSVYDHPRVIIFENISK